MVYKTRGYYNDTPYYWSMHLGKIEFTFFIIPNGINMMKIMFLNYIKDNVNNKDVSIFYFGNFIFCWSKTSNS